MIFSLTSPGVYSTLMDFDLEALRMKRMAELQQQQVKKMNAQLLVKF